MGKIGVFHKKEGAFCTAFTTGRWRLYSALMLAQVCRGEGTGPREGIAGRPISVGISRRGKASGGREAGGWLYAIGSPQRARRETISANGCPRTCRGGGRGEIVCRVPPGNLYSAHPRRGAGGGRERLEEGVLSIHFPMWEAVLKADRAILCGDISICAPCGGMGPAA